MHKNFLGATTYLIIGPCGKINMNKIHIKRSKQVGPAVLNSHWLLFWGYEIITFNIFFIIPFSS